MWLVSSASFAAAVISWLIYCGHERHPRLDCFVWVGWGFAIVAAVSAAFVIK